MDQKTVFLGIFPVAEVQIFRDRAILNITIKRHENDVMMYLQ